MFQQSPRISNIEVSEILTIGKRALARKLDGRNVIVLCAGEPDFDTPEHIKRAAARGLEEGHTKYTTLDGTLELKKAIAAKFRKENLIDYGLDEVTASAGAKQIIYNALMATLADDDEVILLAPYWTSYLDIVTICGGRSVIVSGNAESGFGVTAQQLEAAITPKTKWLFLNSPSNPSGKVFSKDELLEIIAVLKRHPHVWVLSDDVYEHIVYDGLPFYTPAQLDSEIKTRTLTVNAVSKAYAMTGWRLGYAGGPAELIKAMAVVQSQSTSNPASISQVAGVEALTGPQEFLADRCRTFQSRRDYLVERVNSIAGLSCSPPQGAFYMFINCAGILGRSSKQGVPINSDRDFCEFLLENYDLAVVPGSCFGVPGYFRISFAASDAALAGACDRLAQACADLSGKGL